jgi:hypothetical protein
MYDYSENRTTPFAFKAASVLQPMEAPEITCVCVCDVRAVMCTLWGTTDSSQRVQSRDGGGSAWHGAGVGSCQAAGDGESQVTGVCVECVECACVIALSYSHANVVRQLRTAALLPSPGRAHTARCRRRAQAVADCGRVRACR